MELQSLIAAFAAYDSPALAGGGNSFTEAATEKLMTTLCFVDGDGSDRKTMCYVDQFLAGVNRFKGLFTEPPATTQDMSEHDSVLILTILQEPLHQQSGEHIYVGNRLIKKELLCSKLLVNPSQISGRTMLRLAKDCICNCKKMQALVTQSDSPYKDINSTCLGQIMRIMSSGVCQQCTKMNKGPAVKTKKTKGKK